MANLSEQVERLSEDPDYTTIEVDADWDMVHTDGGEVDIDAPITIHCLVDDDGDLDERESKIIAEANGREVELCASVMGLLKEATERTPHPDENPLDGRAFGFSCPRPSFI